MSQSDEQSVWYWGRSGFESVTYLTYSGSIVRNNWHLLDEIFPQILQSQKMAFLCLPLTCYSIVENPSPWCVTTPPLPQREQLQTLYFCMISMFWKASENVQSTFTKLTYSNHGNALLRFSSQSSIFQSPIYEPEVITTRSWFQAKSR